MAGTNGGPEQDETGTRSRYTPPRIDTSKPPVEEARMPLFYLGEQEYTGPVHVSAATALEALEIAYEKGHAAAAYHCLIKCMGEDAYKDLVACPQLTFDEARTIASQVSAMYFGQAVSVAGK